MINTLTAEAFAPATFNLTATSQNVCVGQGVLGGIFVSTAATSPSITIYDDAATGTTKLLVPTFTPTAGVWYRFPFNFGNGVNIVVVGTVTGTIGFLPRN